jgi:hypothetical protein
MYIRFEKRVNKRLKKGSGKWQLKKLLMN